MRYLIIFLMSFALVYLIYFITVILPSRKVNVFEESNKVKYFVSKYDLDIKKINMKEFINVISLFDSFIISLSFTFTFLSSNFWIGMLIGLAFLIPLMLICYSIIGNYYKKEGK